MINMIDIKAPENCPSISIDGITFGVDPRGFISIPESLVFIALSHGFCLSAPEQTDADDSQIMNNNDQNDQERPVTHEDNKIVSLNKKKRGRPRIAA